MFKIKIKKKKHGTNCRMLHRKSLDDCKKSWKNADGRLCYFPPGCANVNVASK